MKNNYFDNLKLNVNELKNRVFLSGVRKTTTSCLSWIDLLFNIIVQKTSISKEFVYSYLLAGWFDDFKVFWQKILKGRPIDIIDYHYLRLWYRTKFQNISHFNESNEKDFLRAWNSDEDVYLLLGSVWKYAKTAYLDFLPYFFQLPKSGKVLEYGCGIAPFTTGMRRYFPFNKYKFEIVDILQINFLYAIYNLSNYSNVKYRFLEPYRNLVEKKKYTLIICQEVLEHVPNPFEVVKSFYDGLEKDGVLVFDYIKSNGDGLDSKKSMADREKTLKFIQKKFRLVKGNLNLKESVSLCVMKKV